MREPASFWWKNVSGKRFHSTTSQFSGNAIVVETCYQRLPKEVLSSCNRWGAGLISFNKNNRANLCGEKKKSSMKLPGVSKPKQTSSPLVRASTPDDKRVTRSKLA